MTDDLIIFEEEKYATTQHMESIEHTLQVLSIELCNARREIESLKEQLNTHINSHHDTEMHSSRFRITHLSKYPTSNDVLSARRNVLIDIQ